MLTFLNSYLLPALGLSILPILIHLLTRHRVKEQKFSDTRFLEEIHRKRMRQIKLRQWILLILRTLALFFVIAAFTRPAIRGINLGGLGTHQQTAAAILIDNSYSTGAVRGSADVFTYEKAAVNKILSLMTPEDVANVGVFNDTVMWLSPKPTRFVSNLSARMDTISISDRGTDIASAVESAAKMLENYAAVNREIYLITDNTAVGWRGKKISVPEGIRLYALAIPPDKPDNRTLSAIEFPSQLLEVKKPFSITAEIKNNSARAIQDVVLSMIIDGKKTSQAIVEIPPGAKIYANLTGQVLSGGFHWGYVESSQDNLHQDNRRYFTFRIPKKVRVLVAGEPKGRKFVSLALAPEGKSEFFDVRSIGLANLGSITFERYDVVILIDPNSVDDATAQRIKTFITRGGGMIVIPGDGNAENPGKFQNFLKNFGDIIVTAAVGDTTGLSQLGWGKTDFNHPILSVFAETGLPGAIFHRIIQFDVRDGRVFLRFDNNMPALAEVSLGDGKIIVCGFSTDLKWGNLVLSGFFVPFVQRSAQYLASDVAYFDTGVLVGRDVIRTLPDYAGTGKLKVSFPQGGGIYVLPKFVGGKATVVVRDLPRAGIYAITDGADTLDLFCANVDPAEGDLTPLTDEDRDKFNIIWLDPTKDLSEQVFAARFGVELWRPLLILALILLALEMIIEKNWKQKNP
ncbi:BatA domain-containing protein [bacterium]|nr:BatA domain-containing protein [bacterium]